MNKEIRAYNAKLSKNEREICDSLMKEIDARLRNSENKIWHRHPVWFLNGNPVVGYSSLKDGIRLMFWSGVSFKEKTLKPGSGKFKDASILYSDASEINPKDLRRWLTKAQKIQWDYKNIVKRKGKLLRLKLEKA